MAKSLLVWHSVTSAGSSGYVQAVAAGIEDYLRDRIENRKKRIKKGEMFGFFQGQQFQEYMVDHVPEQSRGFYKRTITWSCFTPKITGELLQLTGGVTGTLLDTGEQEVYLKRHSFSGEVSLSGKKLAAEVGAFQLSKLLGLDLVPYTRVVKYSKFVFACQDAVDDESSSYLQGVNVHDITGKLTLDQGWIDELSNLQAFDFIGSFTDRNVNTLFFDMQAYKIKAPENDTGFSYILPPDSSASVSGIGLPAVYSQHMKNVLRGLTWKKLRKGLKALPSDAVEGVWMRVKIVLADMNIKDGAGES